MDNTSNLTTTLFSSGWMCSLLDLMYVIIFCAFHGEMPLSVIYAIIFAPYHVNYWIFHCLSMPLHATIDIVHRQLIWTHCINMCNLSITNACISAAAMTIPRTYNRSETGRVPDWSEHVRPLRLLPKTSKTSVLSLLLWLSVAIVCDDVHCG